MKIKENNLKLIVKKEKGGELIPMVQKGQTTTKWKSPQRILTKNVTIKTISNGNGYKSYPLRNSTGQDFYGYSGNDLLTVGIYGIGHSYTKNNLNYGLNTTYRANRDLKMGNLTIKKGLSFRVRRDGDRWKGNYILDIFNSPVTETIYEKEFPELEVTVPVIQKPKEVSKPKKKSTPKKIINKKQVVVLPKVAITSLPGIDIPRTMVMPADPSLTAVDVVSNSIMQHAGAPHSNLPVGTPMLTPEELREARLRYLGHE